MASWEEAEIERLVRAWMRVNEDPLTGVNVNREGFWNRVTHELNTANGANSRTKDQAYSRWHKVNRKMRLFNDAFHGAQHQMPDPATDEARIQHALTVYRAVQNHDFPHLGAWRIIRFHPGWAPIAN
jgi:hypothetical protein